jgi:ankyrin repeat protein
LLLDAGAKALARDNSQRTAMYRAASVEVIQELVRAGLPLEDADAYGWSPLADAVGGGEDAMPRLRALIEAGANVNATHDRGYTVFMSAVAAMERDPEILRLLIASGANPHAITELGYNAFHAAIDVNGEANAEASVRDTLTYLSQFGVNIEHRNNAGQTPLARAIAEGTEIEVRILCELGADPNAICPKHECGDESCTRIDLPLLFHAACGYGVRADAKTEALLKAGANPHATDSEGFTALQLIVADVCSNAENYEESYESFFRGLDKLNLRRKRGREANDRFLDAVMPGIRTYVEQFAAAIRIPANDEYEEKALREKIGCITLLCAYASCAR